MIENSQINLENTTSIIFLGETGVGKSSACNYFFSTPKFKIGEGLDSETSVSRGFKGEGEFSDLFIIDTPGLNDSKGADEANFRSIYDFIKANPRIKGIVLMFSYGMERFTSSMKKV